MTSTRVRDFMVGLFVLIGLGSVAYLSFSVGGARYGGRPAVRLYATFDQVADLKPRAPVEMAGVKIGEVKRVFLDDNYRARVEFEVDSAMQIPVDSSAAIVTSGLLGDRYLSIEPGAEDVFLEPEDELSYTESALVLERIVGKFLYNFNSKDK